VGVGGQKDPYPLYPKILKQYFAEDHPKIELLIYLPEPDSSPGNLQILEGIFKKYKERNCNISLEFEKTWDENILFQYADYFITTRSSKTVFRTCLA